jgi:peptidoglycan hydrolase-like protein with peptidoglycan-binding domain
MRRNPFTFESEEAENQSQFEDSFEFFDNENEGEFDEYEFDEAEGEFDGFELDEYENESGEAAYEGEIRRGGGGRFPARQTRFRSRPRSPQRPKPRRPRSPIGYPPPFFSVSSNLAAPFQDNPELIRLVQSLLNRVSGLNLPVDGVLNVETRSAIRNFQNKNDAADKNTGSNAEPAGDNAEPFSTDNGKATAQSEFEYFELELDDEVNRQSTGYARWIQQSLNKILGLRLTVDGVVGTLTRSAIRSFQQRYGLTADGVVGPITEAAMIRAGASQPPQSSAPSVPTPGTGGTIDTVLVRGVRVARQIAPQVESLLAAAERDGVRLSGGGFRTRDQQIALRIAHCGGNTHYNIYEKPSSQCSPPTAPPGYSNHEKGLAIDFTYNGQGIETHSNPGYIWLANNAEKYGLYNLPSEPWHWSVNGK